MAEVHKGNQARKVRALLSKTVARGCTPGEAASALETAHKIVEAYGLDATKFEWPPAPTAKGKREKGALPRRLVEALDLIRAAGAGGISAEELQIALGVQRVNVASAYITFLKKRGIKITIHKRKEGETGKRYSAA